MTATCTRFEQLISRLAVLPSSSTLLASGATVAVVLSALRNDLPRCAQRALTAAEERDLAAIEAAVAAAEAQVGGGLSPILVGLGAVLGGLGIAWAVWGRR